MPVELRGVIPANILPFDEDYAIDLQQYRRHLEDLVATPGVCGITCNGHAAEVTSLTRAEWQLALAIAIETVNRKVPVICGIYAETHREAADLARLAASTGADALLLLPPNLLLFDARRDVYFDRFAAVAEAVNLPLVIFAYPRWTGMHCDEDLLAKLCTIPTVAAVKDWTLDIVVYERNLQILRSQSRHIAMLSSFSASLLPTLIAGADGILSGHGSVIAALQARLFDLVGRGDIAAARNVYQRIQILTRVIYRSPFAEMHARMKEQLAMLGRLRTAIARPPLPPIEDEERLNLRDALIEAGLLDAVASPRSSRVSLSRPLHRTTSPVSPRAHIDG